ncbi:hypothetical protein [Salibacter sp.]|uniref:hypothetical protein n=1 Tax=Salibacter sp. TaxID=2010995 RepID=UPI00286FD63F|nr:hypothetical protein [Salibacter sp.]MDR9398888.1 hypothetical protein [Salibacter sp.]MDR9488293.1 hypothetical protein [Salibacter sp.]
MKRTTLFILSALLVFAWSCKSPYGSKLKDPFSGNRYESNNRFFRAVGKAQSRDEQIAMKKADVQARASLAGQVETQIKEIADDFFVQTDYEDKNEITGKFQSLTRAVVNTKIGEIRKIGEEKYFNEQEYTVFIAYEIKKKDLYEYLKEHAQNNGQKQNLTAQEKKMINEMLQQQIDQLDD